MAQKEIGDRLTEIEAMMPSASCRRCARAGVAMWSRLLALALLVLPAPALAGVKEKVAALVPSALVLVMDAEDNPPGLSMLIARHDKFAYRQCLGSLRPGGPPMREDAIFRIYSMTKPIISVAAMMLVEEGRLSIIDPVSAYIPAFADVKVGVPNGESLDLAPLKRPITIQDLMRHTSGLTYGFTGVSPVQKLVKAADVRRIDRTTAEVVEAIASLRSPKRCRIRGHCCRRR